MCFLKKKERSVSLPSLEAAQYVAIQMPANVEIILLHWQLSSPSPEGNSHVHFKVN